MFKYIYSWSISCTPLLRLLFLYKNLRFLSLKNLTPIFSAAIRPKNKLKTPEESLNVILSDPYQIFWYKRLPSATSGFDPNFTQKWKKSSFDQNSKIYNIFDIFWFFCWKSAKTSNFLSKSRWKTSTSACLPLKLDFGQILKNRLFRGQNVPFLIHFFYYTIFSLLLA